MPARSRVVARRRAARRRRRARACADRSAARRSLDVLATTRVVVAVNVAAVDGSNSPRAEKSWACARSRPAADAGSRRGFGPCTSSGVSRLGGRAATARRVGDERACPGDHIHMACAVCTWHASLHAPYVRTFILCAPPAQLEHEFNRHRTNLGTLGHEVKAPKPQRRATTTAPASYSATYTRTARCGLCSRSSTRSSTCSARPGLLAPTSRCSARITISMAGRGAGRATFRASARAGCRRRWRRARSCRSARTTSGASSALSPRARRARCESRDRQGDAVMPRLRVPRAAAMRMPRPPRAAFVIVTTACRSWRCLTAPSSRRLLCPPTCGIARRSRARASAAYRPRRRPRIRCCESAPYGSWPPLGGRGRRSVTLGQRPPIGGAVVVGRRETANPLRCYRAWPSASQRLHRSPTPSRCFAPRGADCATSMLTVRCPSRGTPSSEPTAYWHSSALFSVHITAHICSRPNLGPTRSYADLAANATAGSSGAGYTSQAYLHGECTDVHARERVTV